MWNAKGINSPKQAAPGLGVVVIGAGSVCVCRGRGVGGGERGPVSLIARALTDQSYLVCRAGMITSSKHETVKTRTDVIRAGNSNISHW